MKWEQLHLHGAMEDINLFYISGHWDGASIHIAGTGYRKQLEAFARRIARFKIIFIPEVSQRIQ